jgi:ABC-type spermidine/putrescine transport system permease subunit I
MSDIAAVAPWRIRRPGPLWMALPGLLYLLAFLLLPCLRLLSLSFEDTDTGAYTLDAYRHAFGVSVYTRVLSTTFAVAAETTALCLLLGYPLAYWLSSQKPRRQRLLSLLVLFPFWTSALVKNFVWLVLLGRNGVVAETLRAIGIAQPPDLLFSRGTVVFAMVHTMLPLGVVSMLPVMGQIDRALPRAAATMGASGAQAFWRVFFQLSMPGVAAAGLLVFIGSLGFFITPALLGGPRDTMLGQVIIQQINAQQNWQFGAALSATGCSSFLPFRAAATAIGVAAACCVARACGCWRWPAMPATRHRASAAAPASAGCCRPTRGCWWRCCCCRSSPSSRWRSPAPISCPFRRRATGCAGCAPTWSQRSGSPPRCVPSASGSPAPA